MSDMRRIVIDKRGFMANSLCVAGSVGDYYSLQGKLLSTCSADLYEATSKAEGRLLSAWIMRTPIVPESEDVKNFLDRINTMVMIKQKINKVVDYGVDSNGVAFVIMPQMDGQQMGVGNIEVMEAERRFTTCLRVVDRIHKAGLVCGDISSSSFWIDRIGEVVFIGMLGMRTADGCPTEVAQFLAPELLNGAAPTPQADVFSLGVLGYFLLTGQFPYSYGNFDINSVPPLSEFIDVPPIWADEVLRKCIDENPENRYETAEGVFKAITEVRQRALSAGSSVVRSSQSVTLSAKQKPSSQQQYVHTAPKVEEAAKVEEPKKEKIKLPPINKTKAGGIGLVVLLLAYLIFGGGKKDPVPTDIQVEGKIEAFDAEQAPVVVLSDLEKKFEEWKDSDDPIAYNNIVEVASTTTDIALRQKAEKELLRRAGRAQNLRSQGQVKAWLSRLTDKKVPEHYADVLNLLDPSLPVSNKHSLLRSVYPKDPNFVLRLAAALSLDAKKSDDYQAVLAQMIGDALDFEDASQYSALALLLAHPQLATVFGEDVVQEREKLSNEDLLWLIPILAHRGDINTRPVADLAVTKGVLSERRTAFLKMVRDRSDLPDDVQSALIKAASGTITADDVVAFGKWIDMDAEKALILVLADNDDETILLSAFDLLAAKSVESKTAAIMVDWIRKKHWDIRGKLAKSVGILSSLDTSTPEEIDASLRAFDAANDGRRVVSIFTKGGNPKILKAVLERYQDVVDLTDKLQLLGHADEGVRIAAIKSIHTNDLIAQKIILDHYDSEKSKTVRQVYKEQFPDFVARRHF